MTWVNFQKVREQLEFSELLSHFGFEIKTNGKHQVKIHCPFHDDTNPSCGVNLTKKVFHCFSCQAKGNILDFYARMEGLDPENPRDLRKAALLAVETFDIDGGSQESKAGDQPKAKSKTGKPNKAKKQASKGIKKSEGSEVGNSEVKPDSEACTDSQEHNKPRNAPLSFELQLDATHPFLKDRSIPKKLAKSFGLGFAKRGSMAGRICFPIHNEAGELIAYSGRWIEEKTPKGVPRYLLPKGFEKSQVLFNLHRVIEHRERLEKENVATASSVVIVEGFWSVLRLHDAGVPVVSTFGDSISKAQVDLLVQAGFDKAVLIFDGDEGGRMGAEQALPVLAEQLFVKVVALEDGVKPDTMSDVLLNSLPRYVRSS